MSRNLSIIVLGYCGEEKLLRTLESLDGDLSYEVKVYYSGSKPLIETDSLNFDLKFRAGGFKEAIKECKTRYITFLKPGDTIDKIQNPEDDEERPILLGTLDGEYETGSTHSLASLIYETQTLPRDLRGMMFNLEKVKIIGDTEPEKLVSVLSKLPDLDSSSYYESWGKYEDKTFQITSGDIISEENEKFIEDCKKAWNSIDFNREMRELLWGRISRVASEIIELNSEKVDDYIVYLKRENKLNILN